MDDCAQALQKANEAIMAAALVGAKHESHEATCARRYQDWRDSTDTLNQTIARLDQAMTNRVGGIYKILWTTSGATIVTLVSAIGFMAFYMMTHAK